MFSISLWDSFSFLIRIASFPTAIWIYQKTPGRFQFIIYVDLRVYWPPRALPGGFPLLWYLFSHFPHHVRTFGRCNQKNPSENLDIFVRQKGWERLFFGLNVWWHICPVVWKTHWSRRFRFLWKFLCMLSYYYYYYCYYILLSVIVLLMIIKIDRCHPCIVWQSRIWTWLGILRRLQVCCFASLRKSCLPTGLLHVEHFGYRKCRGCEWVWGWVHGNLRYPPQSYPPFEGGTLNSHDFVLQVTDVTGPWHVCSIVLPFCRGSCRVCQTSIFRNLVFSLDLFFWWVVDPFYHLIYHYELYRYLGNTVISPVYNHLKQIQAIDVCVQHTFFRSYMT